MDPLEDIPEQTLSPTPTPNDIYYNIEDFVRYFQEVCSCICDKCKVNKKKNFNYLLTFLSYIIENKDYVKNDNQLCYLISSILPLTLYLCEGSSSNEITNYKKKHNQCLGICYENEEGEENFEKFENLTNITLIENFDLVEYCY